MKPYEEYQPTEYDWLPKIPKHWSKRSIRTLTKLSDKRNGNREDLELLSVYREYGVIRKASRDDNHNVESLDLSNYKYVGKDYLVMNKMKMWQGSLGVSSYEGIVSPAYIVCHFSIDANYKYFQFLLRSTTFKTQYNRISYGIRVGQWDMRYNDFKNINLYIPPRPEQDQIVKFLDFKISKINKFIKDKKREIELLKEQKQAEINRAVTKGLCSNVTMINSGIDWIGEIPMHWAVRRLRTFCDFVNRGSTPAYTEEKLTKVVNQATFSKGYWDLKNVRYSTADVENNRGLIFHNDILLASTGGGVLGKSYLFKENDSYIADSHVTIIRDSKRRFIPEFLYYYLSVSYDLINGILSQGSTNQIELQRNWLRSMFFPYPDINEQKDIALFLMNFENTINTIIQSIEIEIVKIQEYKTSLISEVVTGKVDVRDVKIDEVFEQETLDETEIEEEVAEE